MAEYEQQYQEHIPEQLDPSRSGDDDQDGSKRKRQDDGPQTRTKRSRYITIACNECKRRKIKCNGEVPCQRCSNQNLPCLYTPNCCSSVFRETNEYKEMSNQIMDLQGQVDALWHHLNNLRSSLGQEIPPPPPQPPARDPYAYNEASRAIPAPQPSMMIDPALNRGRPASQQNRSQDNTNNYDLARSSLQSMSMAASDTGASGDPAIHDDRPSNIPPADPERQGIEANHERALAELLHNAELQQSQMAQPHGRQFAKAVEDSGQSWDAKTQPA